MRTRKAILPDAKHIHDLISAYSSDGTLLPRTLAEICENVRDFVVLENEGRIIGCGALHLYGTHLAEIRSITVGPRAQGHGGGTRLMKALMAEAKRHRVDCIARVSRWRGARTFPTRFTRIATSAPGFTDVMKSPWCVASSLHSPFSPNRRTGW
jgi:GNAT superfamily N-acetyltransferase